jgi:hypothetical protein
MERLNVFIANFILLPRSDVAPFPGFDRRRCIGAGP